jgi:hypothetical protein
MRRGAVLASAGVAGWVLAVTVSGGAGLGGTADGGAAAVRPTLGVAWLGGAT